MLSSQRPITFSAMKVRGRLWPITRRAAQSVAPVWQPMSSTSPSKVLFKRLALVQLNRIKRMSRTRLCTNFISTTRPLRSHLALLLVKSKTSEKRCLHCVISLIQARFLGSISAESVRDQSQALPMTAATCKASGYTIVRDNQVPTAAPPRPMPANIRNISTPRRRALPASSRSAANHAEQLQ